MSEHTPGEWHVRPNNGGRFTLLEQQSSDPSSAEARANAHLIAAAPELLAACEAIVAWFDAESKSLPEWSHDECLTACYECEALARAAIAKATEVTE